MTAARNIVSEYKALTIVEEATFDTDPGTGYAAVHACNITIPEIIQEMLRAGYTNSEDERGPGAAVPGVKSGKVTWEMPLKGGGGSEAEIVNLIEHCGTQKVSQAIKTGLITAGTPTTFVILTVDAADLAVGQLIMHVPAGAGNKSIRRITKIITGTPALSNTYTVNAAFNTTPVITDSLAAGITITPKTGNASKTFALKIYMGQGATDRLLLTVTGCSLDWKFKTTVAKKLPMVEFTANYTGWAATEASVTQAADTTPTAYPVVSSKLYIGGTAVDTKSIGFDPGLKIEEYIATSGANGRQNWFASESEPKIDFEPLHNIDFITALSTPTAQELLFESIKDANEAWGIAVPAAQIEKYGLAPDGKLLRAKMDFTVINPGKCDADTGNGNAVVNHPKWALFISS